eukprot:CCRYP_005204-RA/>CCRYP_005204-RA protein AED:0.00 eAED:0.00 QI:16/1/1/1/0/0/2/4/71
MITCKNKIKHKNRNSFGFFDIFQSENRLRLIKAQKLEESVSSYSRGTKITWEHQKCIQWGLNPRVRTYNAS